MFGLFFSILLNVKCHTLSLAIRHYQWLDFTWKYVKSLAAQNKSQTKKNDHTKMKNEVQKVSVAGTWTRVSRVRAEYPNHLDYNGFDGEALPKFIFMPYT